MKKCKILPYEESLAYWQHAHPCVVCVTLKEHREHWRVVVVGVPDGEELFTVSQGQPIEQCLYQLLAYERLIISDEQHFFERVEKRLPNPSAFVQHVLKHLKQRTESICSDKRHITAKQLRNRYIKAQLSQLKSNDH
ncbi:hypothetical protein ACHELK_002298 [Vibrio vulnificus]